MLLEALAKELVTLTSDLVGGRTVNIMDTDGIIVASTEKTRVGTFHQGAYEAVQTGREVNIRRDQLDKYPGAREGCNLPLRVNGSIIGVVGLYGDPTEIRYLAHLLELYVAKYFQLEAMASPKLSEGELRSRILSGLLFPTESTQANTAALMRSQRICLTPPLIAVVLSNHSGTSLSLPQDQPLLSAVEQHLDPRRDLWGIVNDRLVMVVSARERPFGEELKEAIPTLLETRRLSFSAPWNAVSDIPFAYEQALALDTTASGSYNDMTEIPVRCQYFLSRTAGMEAEFLEELRSKALEIFQTKEYLVLLQTAQCYYEHSRSVTQAAQALFVHKNTLQYRMRRLLQVLDLTRCSDFQQEYLIRLLMEHEIRKQGLRALK